MEAAGEIIQTSKEGKTERSDMEVVAGFKYEERYTKYSTTGPLRSIRRYEQAGMKRKLGANVARPLLDSSRKFIVSEFDGKTSRVYSEGGPMKDEQYALILSGITTDEMRRQELDGEILVGNGATSLIRLDEFPLVAATTLDEMIVAGLDCGEGVERDATAFFARKGNIVLDMWKLNGIDHEETVRRIVNFNHKHKIGKLNMDMAFSDYEFNILKYEIPCEQIPFSRHPSEDNREKFANIRAEMMFNFATQVKRGLCVDGFDLTPELKRQACALSWRKDRQGRLLVTPKDDLRVLLKMSTDILDAAALSCVELTNIDDPVIRTAGNDMDEDEIERIMNSRHSRTRTCSRCACDCAGLVASPANSTT